MKLITLKMVRDDWKACYEGERLAELFDTPKTAIEVLTLNDGPWSSVPPEDRLWVVLRGELVSSKTMRLFACWCARQALALIDRPGPRSVAAVEVSERFANGEATDRELAAAGAAAWAAARAAARAAAGAAARDAARAAAGATAWDAARAAAGSAAWSAARDAARDAQLQTLVQMIEQEHGVATP